MQHFIKTTRGVMRRALDMALPPLCAACHAATEAPHGFCASCWAKLSFIAPPHCACCSLPFAFAVGGDDMLCGACLESRPAFAVARAPLTYDDGIRSLMLSFKHADRTDLAPAFAKLMKQAGERLLMDADVLMPVPLHFTRLFLRRYNQSALLARALAGMAGKPVLLHALKRIRATPSQGHLNKTKRAENVKGAFRISERTAPSIKNKNVLLIDDVMTTGATANACAQSLLDAGAAAVNVLILCRVVKAEN